MEEDDIPPIVIDNGSGMCKAGFAGEDTPRTVFTSMVGRQTHNRVVLGISGKDSYVGHEAQELRLYLSLKYPIEHGIVTDWNEMETIWHHTFYNGLCADPEEHPVLLTEAPLNPKANREKMTEIMFETFNIPAMYISSSQVLSLYSQGYTTGLVVDSGHDSTHIVPVHKEHVLRHSVVTADIGGQQLTEYLTKLLNERGYHMGLYSQSYNYGNTDNDIKEKLAYVSAENFISSNKAKNCSNSTKKFVPLIYKLPCGQLITLREERFKCTEALFYPSLIGSKQDGIHVAINKSILQSDIDIQHNLYTNIVLAGGNTMFPGIKERFYTELSVLAPNIKSIKIRAAPDRKYSAWIGGSMLASSDAFEKICVTKQCYDEYGPEIILRKCI